MVELETPQAGSPMDRLRRAMLTLLLGAILADGANKLRLGPTEDIPWFKRQTRLTFARCGVVDPRSLADYRAHGGYKGLERALAAGAEAVVEEVVQSGLRGRGAPEFPTGIKWRTVAQTQAPQKYVVCNADEGDSGTFRRPHDHGGRSLRTDRGDGDRRDRGRSDQGLRLHPLRIPAFRRHDGGGHRRRAARRGARQARSDSAYAFDMEVRVGAGAYVCGEETSLLDSLEGKRGLVRAKPPLPAHKGLSAARR